MVFLKVIFEKVFIDRQMAKKHAQLPACKELSGAIGIWNKHHFYMRCLEEGSGNTNDTQEVNTLTPTPRWSSVCSFMSFNSYHSRGDFCHLLIIFANSLAQDQDRQNVGPDLDPNRFKL